MLYFYFAAESRFNQHGVAPHHSVAGDQYVGLRLLWTWSFSQVGRGQRTRSCGECYFRKRNESAVEHNRCCTSRNMMLLAYLYVRAKHLETCLTPQSQERQDYDSASRACMVGTKISMIYYISTIYIYISW